MNQTLTCISECLKKLALQNSHMNLLSLSRVNFFSPITPGYATRTDLLLHSTWQSFMLVGANVVRHTLQSFVSFALFFLKDKQWVPKHQEFIDSAITVVSLNCLIPQRDLFWIWHLFSLADHYYLWNLPCNYLQGFHHRRRATTRYCLCGIWKASYATTTAIIP